MMITLKHSKPGNPVIGHKQAHELMARFLEGETSISEERVLYRYFSSPDISSDLMKYTDMMRWYATAFDEEASASKPERKLSSRAIILWSMATAAMVAILISIGISFHRQEQFESELHASYQGSFIVRNGKVITDIDLILPELQKAERMSQQRADMLEKEVLQVDDDFYRSDDPEIEALKREAFSDLFSEI